MHKAYKLSSCAFQCTLIFNFLLHYGGPSVHADRGDTCFDGRVNQPWKKVRSVCALLLKPRRRQVSGCKLSIKDTRAKTKKQSTVDHWRVYPTRQSAAEPRKWNYPNGSRWRTIGEFHYHYACVREFSCLNKSETRHYTRVVTTTYSD